MLQVLEFRVLIRRVRLTVSGPFAVVVKSGAATGRSAITAAAAEAAPTEAATTVRLGLSNLDVHRAPQQCLRKQSHAHGL